MPMFEYACRSCGHKFETLVLSASKTVTCPRCASTELEKQFSVFGTSGSSSGKGSGGFSLPTGGG